MQKMRSVVAMLSVCILAIHMFGATQVNAYQDTLEVADVVGVLSVASRTVRVQIASGTVHTVEVPENMKIPTESLYVRHMVEDDGTEYVTYHEPDRRQELLVVCALFTALVLLIARKKGFFAIVSLAISIFLIARYLPIFVTSYVGAWTAPLMVLILFTIVMFVSHGFRRATWLAYSGCVIAIVLTYALSYLTVGYLELSGFFDESTTYLQLVTHGTINFVSLLQVGILLGVMGVVDDIAITQVMIIETLRSKVGTSKSQMYQEAMEIGRSHVGAVVNTLVLAYAGASLPLLAYFSLGDTSFLEVINREMIVTEIVRTLLGVTGILLVLPITTALAIYLKRSGLDEPAAQHTHHHHQ